MLLAIDIGNTTVTFAIMKGKRVAQAYSLDNAALSAELKKTLKKHVKMNDKFHRCCTSL